ncbi:MAG: Asp-tRNA(Asn)/Glu-tRNA(Gln) amidotransferase subunit GatA [Candidatus Paceibacterota bacterium]|jgi:aspartyl-tRNA(Asn)/glutamyl-tRNA(Gln) amidotransferase subunit A
MTINLSNLTIEYAHEAMMRGDFSARELAEAYIETINEKNNDIHAYLEVYDDVLKQADDADKMIKEGKATILTGIPLALKDNILFEGKIASASSKILENYHATYSSTVVEKLKSAGAVILGRTNMDEFAMGSSTENSAYGATKNPHDISRVPGGSSGGSAAAVAMSGALFALGSDTGGSIRQPASFCGVVGLKPTYGAVSRSGLMAMGSSLDQIGPFTKTVADAEIVYQALASHDPLDSTSAPDSFRIQPSPLKKKIGIPRDFIKKEDLNPEVYENFEKAIKKFESLGYEIIDIELPRAAYSLAVYYIVMAAEVSTNLSRFDGVRYGLQIEGKNLLETYQMSRGVGFGKETRRRILLGTYVLSHGYYDAYYNKALKVQRLITLDFKKAFENVDAIITPTSPFPAFKAGEKMSDPLQMYLSDIYTVPANIAGIPAISLPHGTSNEGLPLDLQIMAPHWREDILFTIGKAFEALEK